MKRKPYEKELRKLQAESCHLQEWVEREGLRVLVVFEGRDAAGKGGTIKAITERVSPRVFRLVALPAPSDREKSQIYIQRYLQHFPAAGEVVIFDRSWYDYSRARDRMLEATDSRHAPWTIVRSDDKRRARLDAIAELLERVPYKKVRRPKITVRPRSKKGAYDDQKSLEKRRFVRERY